MPGFVKTPADEARWSKAKAIVAKQKGKSVDSLQGDDFKLVTHIFENMKKSELQPGQSLNDLKKAKIYSFETGKKVAELPSVESSGPKGSVSAVGSNKVHHGVDKKPAAAKLAAGDPDSFEYSKKAGPWAMKLSDGYLIGRQGNPKTSSPCHECVGRWLKYRNVSHEPIDPASIPEERSHDAMEQVSKKTHDKHTVFEVSKETYGAQTTPIYGKIERHPNCKTCNPKKWEGPKHGKAPNYAFSSVNSVRSARFGMPEGNLFISTAHHNSGETTHGIATTKDESRVNAAEKKPTPGKSERPDYIQEMGGEPATKQGHLLVGANNYVRQKMPFFMLQTHDHYLMHHHDEATGKHHAAVISLSRQFENEPVTYHHAEGATGEEAVTKAIHQSILYHGLKQQHEAGPEEGEKPNPTQSKKNLWMTHWIYRQPKRALKDVLTEGKKDVVNKSMWPGMSLNDLRK